MQSHIECISLSPDIFLSSRLQDTFHDLVHQHINREHCLWKGEEKLCWHNCFRMTKWLIVSLQLLYLSARSSRWDMRARCFNIFPLSTNLPYVAEYIIIISLFELVNTLYLVNENNRELWTELQKNNQSIYCNMWLKPFSWICKCHSSPFNPTSTNLVGFELHKYHKNEAHQSDTPYTYIPSVVIKGWVTHCTFSLTLFPWQAGLVVKHWKLLIATTIWSWC